MTDSPHNYDGLRSQWTPERIETAAKHLLMVVIIAVLLGTFSVVSQVYWIAAAIIACLLALLIAWQFSAAIAVYALVACFAWGETPDLVTGGSGVGKSLFVSELMLSLLIAIWFARYLFSALPKPRSRTGFYIPLGIFVAYSVLNVVNSFIFWDPHVNRMYQYASVNMFELGIRVISAAALVMAATSIPDKKMLKWTSVALCCPCLITILDRLIGSPVTLNIPWWSLLSFLPASYCCALVLDSETTIRKRIGSIIALILIIYYVLIQDISWVSGWLGLLMTIMAVVFIKSKKAFAVAAVLAVCCVVIFNSYIQQNIISSSESEGDYQRFGLWEIAIKYATTFPLGIGIGNYRSYNSYYYGVKWGATTHGSAHGTYAQLLTEMGFPGLLIFLWLLIGGFKWMLTSYRKMEPGPSKIFLLAAMGQLIGISIASIFGDYIIPSYHNGGPTNFCATIYSWLIWGVAVAHVRISSISEQALDNSPDT